MAGIEGTTHRGQSRVWPRRSPRRRAPVLAFLAAALVAVACAGPAQPGATESQTRTTTSSAVLTSRDLPDVSAWPRVDHGVLSFPHPPGWTVVEQPGVPVAELRDGNDDAVAYVSTQPFTADTGDLVRYGYVQEVLRLGVDTGADEEQVLLGFVAGPSAEPGVGRGLALRLLSPEAADRLVETGEQSLRFDAAGGEHGVFFSSEGLVRLGGETVEHPDDAQIAAFIETDRFRELAAVMAGVQP
ncbi:hypothetical protein [Zhihengliuella sp.]|uniref:hypothetical protein n=1 Tax=Zhihengliuella sp. TaxID=1954483 RepID=UPI0028119E94|nr:hypothetical protein [Zhihengliuella sp.]